MTFEKWYEQNIKHSPDLCRKEIAEMAWDEAFIEGLKFQTDRIKELNANIKNLRNLRKEHGYDI